MYLNKLSFFIFHWVIFFFKGLDKDDQKEGLFKRLENIKEKNEELLHAFSAANKVSKTAKNEDDFNYESRYAFTNFTETLKNLRELYQ